LCVNNQPGVRLVERSLSARRADQAGNQRLGVGEGRSLPAPTGNGQGKAADEHDHHAHDYEQFHDRESGRRTQAKEAPRDKCSRVLYAHWRVLAGVAHHPHFQLMIRSVAVVARDGAE
jgi:hypothetical protein